MSTPETAKPTIEKTLKEQHGRTMSVINAIKSDTDQLMRKTDSIIDRLVEEGREREPFQPASDVAPQPDPPPPPARPRSPDAPPVPAGIRPADADYLVAEISRLCVKEVMDTVNPILAALDTFIKANGIRTGPEEPEDELFAEKLIEQMKLAVGRRQKIAMARMKRSAP